MYTHPALVGVPPGTLQPPVIPGVTHEIKRKAIDHATNGANTILQKSGRKKLRVINIVAISAGTATVQFQSIGNNAVATNLTGDMALVANVGFAPGEAQHGHFETLPGELLNMQLSAGVSVDGWLTYIEVD